MLNKVCIMGRLVRDPELRRTQSGIAVTTMRIAVERDFKSQDGTKQSDFFDVVAWRNTAEFVSRYFSKGSMMVVDGRLQTKEWTDRDNNRRTSIEIVADNIYFGSSRRDSPNGEYGGYGGANGYGGYGSASGYGSGGPSNGFASGSGYGSNASGGYGSNASGGYGSGYGSNASGGYGSNYGSGGPSNGFASGGYGANASGGYGGYGSGGPSNGFAAGSGYGSNASGSGYGSNASGSGYGSNASGGYGAYGSGGYGGYDNAATPPADANADNGASGAETSAPSKESAPASDAVPTGFAEVADDDGDLPF